MCVLHEAGDLVGPMAVRHDLDACLLMSASRGYDIDHRHGRIDIERHDLSDGWPETGQGVADLGTHRITRRWTAGGRRLIWVYRGRFLG